MIGRGNIVLGAVAAFAVLLASGMPARSVAEAKGGQMPTYSIAITGASGTSFAAECHVGVGAEQTTVAFEGVVPQKREFAGEALRCGIRQRSAQGSLTVELLSSSGNRTTSRTQGGDSTINLSIR